MKNKNKTSYSCLNQSLELVNLEDEKYAEIKKCFYDIDDTDDINTIRKIEVFINSKMCNKNCLKCRRIYDIEYKYFETICEENRILNYHLCLGPFKNNFKENDTRKRKRFVYILGLIILLLTMMVSALLCYCKCKRNNSPSMVSKMKIK